MSNKAGKIIGGFLAGAGILTILLHTKAGKRLKGELAESSKDMLHDAEQKIGEAKDHANSLTDQLVNFAVDNKNTIVDAANYLLKTFLKGK